MHGFGSPRISIMGIIVFFFIPETKDRTLEEIYEMIEMKVTARKFSSYVCAGIQQAVEGGPHDEKTGVEMVNTETIEQTTRRKMDCSCSSVQVFFPL